MANHPRMIINWDPVPQLGPVPINWYGLGWIAAFLAGTLIAKRRAPRYGLTVEAVESLAMWALVGAFIGARLYFIAQNDPWSYIAAPWRVLQVWEGGLAFFGGLFGAIAACWIRMRSGLPFRRAADVFAPAVPVAAAIGRIACFLAGMDYGKATTLPWGIVYTHPESYAPTDGIARHPVQAYELIGDLVIAGALLRMPRTLPTGALFLAYLVMFALLRFALFFVRGDVPAVAFGLANGHWTALVIFVIAAPALYLMLARRRRAGSDRPM